jgi:hypothetical protein
MYKIILNVYLREVRHRPWHRWMGQCATSRKVVGSIPDDVIGIFGSASKSNDYQEYFLVW